MKHTLIPTVLTLVALMSTTHAQPTNAPMNPKGSAMFMDSEYAFIHNKFYLQDRGDNGSGLSNTATKGFRSMNLVNGSSPIWSDSVIQPSRSMDIMAPIALNKDESKLYVFDREQYQPYNLLTSTWEPVVPISPGEHALSMFTDTDSGLIYGLKVTPVLELKDTPMGPRDLSVFDPSTGATPVVVSTMPNVTVIFVGRGVYNSARKRLFFYTPGDRTSNLREYDPVTKIWTALAETGDVPAARTGACFASVGNTLIVAGGGRLANGTEPLPAFELGNNALYLFDLGSSTWTRAANIPIGRFGPACLVYDDYLVLFGGVRDFTSTSDEITDGTLNTFSFYNLKTNTWVSNLNNTGGQDVTSGSVRNTSTLMGTSMSLVVLLAMACLC
ncbi:hypothetical protein BGZ59_011167 [Podila verticillata]|nr:hypothetical protein BGZ59_011167 [Podila verticillata]